MTSVQTLFLEGHDQQDKALQEYLDSLPDLGARLSELNMYHRLTGHVWDTSAADEPVWLAARDRDLTFAAYSRLDRKLRLEERGRSTLPDITPAYGGCPIVKPNLPWQQQGRQFAYTMPINQRPYAFLIQPQNFKFTDGHATMASDRDEPQDWRPRQSTLHWRILDMHAVTAMLRRYVLLWNGAGAGVSIPERFHLHVVPKLDSLPIQQAARLMGLPSGWPSVLRLTGAVWPVTAFRISGPPEFVASEVVRLAARWNHLAGERACESMAMFVEDEMVVCIYVPRDRKRERSNGFGSAVGAYEVAVGVFIFSDEKPGIALRERRIHFDDLWQILRDVQPEMEFPCE